MGNENNGRGGEEKRNKRKKRKKKNHGGREGTWVEKREKITKNVPSRGKYFTCIIKYSLTTALGGRFL